jgi:hypothetical protein
MNAPDLYVSATTFELEVDSPAWLEEFSKIL